MPTASGSSGDATNMTAERMKAREMFLRRAGETKARAQDALLREDVRNVELGVLPKTQAQVDMLQYRLDTRNVVNEMRRVAEAGDALVGLHPSSRAPGNEEQEGFLSTSVASRIPPETDADSCEISSSATSALATPFPAIASLTEEEVEERLAKNAYKLPERQPSSEEVRQRHVERMAQQASKISCARKALPIFKYRAQLLDLVRKNQVIVVIGETGSGKTTQITQYLMEDGFTKPMWWTGAHCPLMPDHPPSATSSSATDQPQQLKFLKIACTQPRRIAATSVAERVAQEAGVRLGEQVGYKVRFDDKTSQKTELLYLTDGMMLKEMANDVMLDTFSVIMVDEAHERSLQTDVLLGLLKDVCRAKPHLRVIVASATLEAGKFQAFFNNCPLFRIEGRTFPVDTFYSNAPVEDYVFESAQQAINIHLEKAIETESGSDILIFLPGQDDIERCADMLREFIAHMGDEVRPLLIFPIYATLPPQQQRLIYTKAPPGTRKVIIATNIAETSITVDGIVYVIDCGLCKQNRFNPISMMEELSVVPTSKASAEQRKGRAGRTKEGVCIRLYTKLMYDNELETETVPEILRSNLSSVVMMLLSIGVTNLVDFDFLDAPSQSALAASLDHLYTLGAINEGAALTSDGKLMSEFPMSPSLSKCIIASVDLCCQQEMAIATSIMSLENALFLPARGEEQQKAVRSAKRELFGKDASGDIVGLVKVFEEWQRTKFSERWCIGTFTNHKALVRAREIRNQTVAIMERLGLDLGLSNPPVNPSQMSVQMTRCLCRGFFTNVAKLDADASTYVIVRPIGSITAGRSFALPPVYIHPSSVHAFSPPAEKPELVIFNEVRQTTKAFMMHVTSIADPQWILDAAPGKFTENDLMIRARKRKR